MRVKSQNLYTHISVSKNQPQRSVHSLTQTSNYFWVFATFHFLPALPAFLWSPAEFFSLCVIRQRIRD